jgi:hypothetical protein
VAGTVQPPRPGETGREYEQSTKRQAGPHEKPRRGPTYADTIPPPWEGGGVWFDEQVEWSEQSRAGFEKYLREHDRAVERSCFISFDPARPDSDITVHRLPAPGDWTDQGHSDPAADIREMYRRWKGAHPPDYLLRVFGDFLRDEIGIEIEPAQEGSQGDAGGREGDAQEADAAGGGTDNRSGPEDPVQ